MTEETNTSSQAGETAVLRGSQLAHLAEVLAEEWREEHPERAQDATVLERLAAAFAEHEEIDEQACVALLGSLDLETEGEWAMVDSLRVSIEERAWLRHPSMRERK